MQALRDLEPLVRRVAGAAHRSMPASADLDDVRQTARIAAWEALQAFDGRGSLSAFAAQCMQRRIIDWQRQQCPGGRGAEPALVVGDDALADMAGDADPARDIERAQQYAARVQQIPVKHRAVAKRILAGERTNDVAADMGLSASRVSQQVAETVAHLQIVPPRVSSQFDPASVLIRMGSMPAPTKRVNKYRQLLGRIPATGSVVLHASAAAALCSEFKRARIAYMTCAAGPGKVEVWREPSPAQRAARKAKA